MHTNKRAVWEIIYKVTIFKFFPKKDLYIYGKCYKIYNWNNRVTYPYAFRKEVLKNNFINGGH